jgi:hypothetical protein
MKLTSILALTLTLFGATAYGQVVLQNFSTTTGANTFFYGSWHLTGSTSGSTSPNSQFVQGAGVFDITGVAGPGLIQPTNSADSKVEFFNTTPVSIGSNLSLAVTAQELGGNVASSFTVFLVDSTSKVAFATFVADDFVNGTFTTVTNSLQLQSGFQPNAVSSMVISGDQLGGTSQFNISFDSIVATSAVPEPGVAAAMMGLTAIALALHRRRQRAKTSSTHSVK